MSEKDVADFSEVELEDIEKYVTKHKDEHSTNIQEDNMMGHWKHIKRFGNHGWKKYKGNSKELIDDILNNKDTSADQTLRVRDSAINHDGDEINKYLDQNKNSVSNKNKERKKKLSSNLGYKRTGNNGRNPFVDDVKVNSGSICYLHAQDILMNKVYGVS